MGSSSFLDRTSSSNQVYPANSGTSATKFPNNDSHDSSKNINAFGRHRVDSESSTNVVKNAILRRTDEIDDPSALPRMSASTVSLSAQPSNREQTLNRIANQTVRHSGNERIYEGTRFGSQGWKDESPTKSIARYLIKYLELQMSVKKSSQYQSLSIVFPFFRSSMSKTSSRASSQETDTNNPSSELSSSYTPAANNCSFAQVKPTSEFSKPTHKTPGMNYKQHQVCNILQLKIQFI